MCQAVNNKWMLAVTTWTTALQTFADSINRRTPGDQNGDAKVSIGGIAVIAAAFGKSNIDPDWEYYKSCDVKADGTIDVAELAVQA
jgi:hypothetical protein